jgi:hypothetical protein
MSEAKREPAKLADPSSKPRQTKSGKQVRDRPIYAEAGGSKADLTSWEVEVTPLRSTTNLGRAVTGGRLKPQALFEVRAGYYGPGLPEFGSQPNTRLIPHTHTNDEELALAIARTVTHILRAGTRELDIVAIAKDVERNRG